MIATELMGKPVLLRELLPQDLKIEINRLSPGDATKVAGYLGHILGEAHVRQMDKASAATWRKEILRRSSRRFDAPSWLWESVVKSISSHEQAYLEHCRKFALEEQRACNHVIAKG
jgi:uncharacterized protein (DUF2252 family)